MPASLRVKPQYAEPGYDPTLESWPMAGPSISALLMLGAILIILVISGIIAYQAFGKKPSLAPLPTLYQLQSPTPTLTPEPSPTKPQKRGVITATPMQLPTIRFFFTAIPPQDLDRYSSPTPTITASSTPTLSPTKLKPKAAATRKPISRGPICNPSELPLCSWENPACCGIYRP